MGLFTERSIVAARGKPAKDVRCQSHKVEAVLVHDVVPRRHEVPHERRRIVSPVDRCNRQNCDFDRDVASGHYHARGPVASRLPLPAALSLGSGKAISGGHRDPASSRLDPEESSRRPHPHGSVPANCGIRPRRQRQSMGQTRLRAAFPGSPFPAAATIGIRRTGTPPH